MSADQSTPQSERVEEIKARLAKITPGPWKEDRNWHVTAPGHNWDRTLNGFHDRMADYRICHVFGPGTVNNASDDFRFIAHAPSDIESLLARVASISEERDKLQKQWDDGFTRRVAFARIAFLVHGKQEGIPIVPEEIAAMVESLVEARSSAEERLRHAASGKTWEEMFAAAMQGQMALAEDLAAMEQARAGDKAMYESTVQSWHDAAKKAEADLAALRAPASTSCLVCGKESVFAIFHAPSGVGVCGPCVNARSSAEERVKELEADKERVDWLEAHDYSASCYNVPTDRDHDRWAAPMKPNNGWIISIDDDEEDEGTSDCHGKTLRDCIDWTRQTLAALASRSQSDVV